jgi:energy-coupling factor transporter ATP-binding protein EcfA2
MTLLLKIIDWFDDKPTFWKYGIEKLIIGNEITESTFSEFIEICKQENGLSKNELKDINLDSLKQSVSNISQANDIRIHRIFGTKNINALSDSSDLTFAPEGLTVVYGDNGSGKSSYVGILKHVCKTRGNLPTITDNLFTPPHNLTNKEAEVEYSVNRTDYNSIKFLDHKISDTVLKSVDVFDAHSAIHYIEGEDEIAFIPHGLTIIEKFAALLRDAEEVFSGELHELNKSSFDFTLLQLDEGTAAKAFIDNLNSETTLDELRNNTRFTEEDNERLIQLKKSIDSIKASDSNTKKQQNSAKIRRLNVLTNKLKSIEDALTGDNLEKLKSMLNDYVTSNDTLKDVSEKVFSELPLTGVGNESWIQLWESARKFYNESIGQELFPETDDNKFCPLCFQELNDEAKRRFISFEEFVKDDVQKTYDSNSAKLQNQINELDNINFDFDSFDPTITEIDESIEDFRNIFISYISDLEFQKTNLRTILKAKIKVESISSPELKNNPRSHINNLIRSLEEENERLDKQSINEILNPLLIEYNELINKKKIYDFKPKLAREICRQRKLKLLNNCIGLCNTRNVTLFSNQLASEFITENLRDNFKKELVGLGFKNIRIETDTRGIRGKQYYFLKLDEPYSNTLKLKDILSEGEHRCIALATFFSELSISDHKSTIIFDDPVSSLDHKWRNKISHRIAEESKQRQVIVFTHDITFLLMLQEHCDSLSCNINVKSLTRKRYETGIVAENPPWDALSVNKRIGVLKNRYQKLEKIERTDTFENYREYVKVLYGLLRETWERFVEEVFLNGTIQRFGRAIQTQRLEKITDLSDADYKKVESNMEKCSTYFHGHDSAGELIEQMPDSNEFLSDITVLEDFTAEIRRRRR